MLTSLLLLDPLGVAHGRLDLGGEVAERARPRCRRFLLSQRAQNPTIIAYVQRRRRRCRHRRGRKQAAHSHGGVTAEVARLLVGEDLRAEAAAKVQRVTRGWQARGRTAPRAYTPRRASRASRTCMFLRSRSSTPLLRTFPHRSRVSLCTGACLARDFEGAVTADVIDVLIPQAHNKIYYRPG